jgi:5-methylcytosine-specific restriction endonuclease McrA
MEKWWIEAQYRDDGRCVYCGFHLYASFEAYWTTQADHLIPQRVLANAAHRESLATHDVFRGGTVEYDAVGNCVTACVFCNQLKGGWFPDGWEQMTRQEIIDANRARLATLRVRHEAEFNRRVRVLAQRRSQS